MIKKKKLTKAHVCAIISTAIAITVAVAIIILNFFIPVKYLAAYVNFSKDAHALGEMRVTFIDVGLGDSTLVEFPDGKTALIDAGNGRRVNETKILKLLNRRGIKTIDYFFCTSVRDTRSGGLAEIIKYKTVGKIFMPDTVHTQINDGYKNFYRAVSGLKDAKTEFCGYGGGIFSEDYFCCFLSPSFSSLKNGEYDKLNENPTDENIDNASAVLYLEYGGAGILLSGDIRSEKAYGLCSAYKLNGSFDVNGRKITLDKCKLIKIANHGDKASACAALYDLIKPSAAIISVGENGRDLPSAQAVADAQVYVKDNLFRTDECGNITVTVGADGTGYKIFKEKK